jgi:hypothetical protein
VYGYVPIPGVYAGSSGLHAAAIFMPSVAMSLSLFMMLMLVSGVIIRSVFFLRRRNAEMRALAGRLSFQPWPDDSLPYGISFRGTPFQQWTKLENIHHGQIDGLHVVLIDYSNGEGKRKCSRTIIAANTDVHLRKPYDLETRQVGQWQFIHAPVRYASDDLMDIDQIAIILQGFKRT